MYGKRILSSTAQDELADKHLSSVTSELESMKIAAPEYKSNDMVSMAKSIDMALGLWGKLQLEEKQPDLQAAISSIADIFASRLHDIMNNIEVAFMPDLRKVLSFAGRGELAHAPSVPPNVAGGVGQTATTATTTTDAIPNVSERASTITTLEATLERIAFGTQSDLDSLSNDIALACIVQERATRALSDASSSTGLATAILGLQRQTSIVLMVSGSSTTC